MNQIIFNWILTSSLLIFDEAVSTDIFSREDESMGFCSSFNRSHIFKNYLSCKPRKALVHLPPFETNEPVMMVTPSQVEVDRCSGSCDISSTRSCQPRITRNVSIPVMLLRLDSQSGLGHILCSTVQVENHNTCACSCQSKNEDCNPNFHFFNPQTCRCECLNQSQRVFCLTEKPSKRVGRLWDARTCSCRCPRHTWKECSSGYVYDSQEACTCIPTYSRIASGGLIFAVLLVVVITFVGGYAVFHVKRKKSSSRKDFSSNSGYLHINTF